MRKIRVLLADDHETILERVRMALGEHFDIVGAVKNGRAAVLETRRLDPDVLVIDVSMPILDGLQAATQLRFSECRTKIVFLTVHEDRDFVNAALSAGASGYVVKANLAADLATAISEAVEGHIYVSKSIPP